MEVQRQMSLGFPKKSILEMDDSINKNGV